MAEIMEINGFGNYYLNYTFDHYKLNPCEQEAFDFERDMTAFLKADPEKRADLLKSMQDCRNDLYSQTYPQSYPQHAPAIAA